MKKVFEEPMLDILRFEMRERITWEEAGGEDIIIGDTSEGVEEW